MSRRERATSVPLDGLSGGQLDFLRETVGDELIGRARDLRLLHGLPDPKGAIREVAALGRLAFWLHHGEIRIPDRAARDVMARISEEFRQMDEGLFERYERAIVQHDALRAFAACFEEVEGDA